MTKVDSFTMVRLEKVSMHDRCKSIEADYLLNVSLETQSFNSPLKLAVPVHSSRNTISFVTETAAA